jgi:hypothetical protein
LYVSIVTVLPHASWLMERLSPAFWATPVPGSAMVPRADLTMFVMASASTTMHELPQQADDDQAEHVRQEDAGR